ncbi:MAG: S9 family peptidase [Armatimonadaceae bacterium]
MNHHETSETAQNTQAIESQPPLIPRAILFGNPERASPRISPDGTRIAYLAPRDGVMNLYVRALGEAEAHPLTEETVRPIRAFYWAENGRHLLYPQDVGGDENFHLHRVDVETGETTDLTPFPGVRASLFALEPDHPDTILLTMNRRDSRFFDAYRCELPTGELTCIAENPGNVIGWEANHDLEVCAAVASRPDGGSDVLVRDSTDAPWRVLLSCPFGERADVLAFTPEGKGLYLLTDKDVNTVRLFVADVATGERQQIHAREDVDVSNLWFHPVTRTPDAIAYNRSRQEWHALDAETAADIAALQKADAGDLIEVSRSRDNQVWTVGFLRDNGPVRYYLYHRTTGQTEFLFTSRPSLEGLALATMTPVEISARDGLVMPCYLTLPPNVPPQNLPMVLLVHGGPWARDMWGYSSEVQWLANRGYAVLQVNYRGSSGFGKAHLNAGNREWAAKMHDDLLDAVEWAVSQGYADRSKIAIMGGSYGGYATLVGLTFTPEVFACGVDLVGPSNLLTLMESIPPYWEPIRAQFIQRVGNPETERDFLISRSPLFKAECIVRPLLIAQGANDPRVKQPESDQIVAAARQNAKDVLYLLYQDEGHGFARPENRISYTAAVESFLATHLGGRFEPAHPGEEPPIVPSDARP